MSKWKEIPKEDIEIDGEDIDILIGSDSEGNNYVTVKVEDMLALFEAGK